MSINGQIKDYLN